jgi:hypothetical protein
MTCVYLCLALLLASVAPATAETYPVRDSSGGQASAVCVGVMYGKGRTNPRWVFLTNRHVVTEQGRTVGVWVGSDDGKWIQGQSVRASNIKNRDVASFTVAHNAGQFRKVRLLEGVPDGATASVCGYSRFRDQFCWTGRLSGTQVTANGRHAMPGDSGGAVLVKESGKSYLAGLTWAYGDDQSTYVVTAKDCCSHLQWAYGAHPKCVQWHSVQQCPNGQCPMHPQQPSRPSYRRYERVQPQFLAPPRIERYEESTIPQTIEPPQPAPQPPVSEQRIQDAVTQWMKSNRDQLRGQDGSDGRDGVNAQSVSVAEISEYLIANHGSQLRGPVGATGPAGSQGSPGQQGLPGESGRDGKDGARGLVGVPDEADIRNWLVGAASDPQTRQMLATLLANLVAADPRVDALIQRLDQLEQQSPADVTAITQRVDDVEARLTSVVPVRILNNDGSVFSADEERRALDPIEFKLLPPDKGE